MGKKKEESAPVQTITKEPAFRDTTLMMGDETISKAYKNTDGSITYKYMETPEQAAARKQYDEMLREYIPKVNTFSDEFLATLDKKMGAYEKQGIDKITGIYDPMINDLKNDIVSRFGTLNSSSFIDDLNSIEKNRSNAVEELTTDLLLKRDEFKDAELERQYDFINMLQGKQSEAMNNFYNAMKLTNVDYGDTNTTTKTSSEEESNKYLPFYLK